MSKRRHILLSSLLGIGLIVSAVFGAYYAKEAFRVREMLELGYTQRLLESREHLQSIGVKLGKLPAAGEIATQIELLSGVSIQAEGLVSGLSALPLSHAGMEETIAFSNQVSEYTLLLSLKLASGQSLTNEERDVLSGMYHQCRLLEGQFAVAWNAMQKDSMMLMGQENVFYQQAETEKRPLEMTGASAMEYPSMIYDGAFSDGNRKKTPKGLGSETVDESEAIRRAIRYVGQERVENAQHSADVSGQLPCYGVMLTLRDGTTLNAAVTKQGGHMLWIMPEHAEFPATLTLEECRISAQQFLTQHDYGPVESSHFQVYDGLAVITFTPLQDDILLYPDLIKVQVRMDTGEVVGMDANQYLMNHTQRQNLTPGISSDEASAAVGERLKNKQVRLCVIPHRGSERLCYEISGDRDGQQYRVYVDAETGHEVELLLMVDTEGGQLSV